jgi:hypothetical protein
MLEKLFATQKKLCENSALAIWRERGGAQRK